ncbi:hypothetical protein [Jannaschia aquimarina]|uniref:Uncharacterized protein n=1 Tax=Jannaschia aquimarina TaxID=935700 RepID=A0A0D1DD98_9RHOB|nr:hypothetical protein [Jannaschia aquimarina]KIT17973.1 hypothetical protein jaqu_02610 [Jannaschia aquimarina]SNT04666.1 hypothetical protein SAMN05421775_10511 [Jannaschia aquimarina]
MIHGIGHNSRHDPNGYSGRLHQWRRARADLLGKTLPVEVIRMRVRRAEALGLDFRTYAGVRAATGRDVVAMLFSSGAVGMLRRAELDARAAAKLARVEAQRGVLVHAPLALDAPPPLDWADRAPAFTESWAAMRDRLRGVLIERRLPGDAVLLVGATGAEREWCAAMGAAGWIDAERYFAA